MEVALSQTLPCKNITINDGLTSNNIKCLFKDSRGLMWIGTDAGLCSYDGSNYKIFNETNGLKNSEIWAIAEDNHKNLWLSLYGNGLAKFDGKKFTYYDKNDGLVNNAIRKMYYSKKNNCLVLGTENGLSLFDGKHFKNFIKKTATNHFQVVGIVETNNKLLVTVSHDKVYSINFNSNIAESSLRWEFTPIPSYSSFVFGNYFYGGIGQLYRRDLKTGSETSIPCPIIWDFAKDENSIYCAAWNVNNPTGGLFKLIANKLTDITKQANVKSTGLWCLYFDKSTKQLWVGSIDKGIYIVDLSNKIHFFKPDFFGLKSLESQQLLMHNNTIWVGARDKIVVIDDKLKCITLENEAIWKKIKLYFKKKGIKIDEFQLKEKANGFSCFNIVADQEGFVWITSTIGTFCFDSKFDIRYFNFNDGGNLIFDNKDQAIFGKMYSNVFLSPKKYNSENQIIFSFKEPNIPKDITKSIKEGNSIWYGTNSSGLFKFENNKFISLFEAGLFKEKKINDLFINDNRELVIGTNGGIVYVTKWKNGKLIIISVLKPGEEIFGNSISFIQQSNGVYFIGTNKGINIVKDNKFVKLINKSEGINDLQFNDCIKDKNGDLWIATNEGLIRLNANTIINYKQFKLNRISINEVLINAKSCEKIEQSKFWGIINRNKLELDYNQNNIEILFNNNNLLNADKNLYRYKIIGLSDIWSDYATIGKIQLLGIPSGEYSVLLEGKNIGSGEIFQSKNFNLVIAPPFWKTWWFIIGSIICFSIFSFIIYKKRIQLIEKRERDKAKIQKRLVETKMEALQSQMNPHFIFNAMNSIQNFIIDNDADKALMYMGEFSKLIRQTLDSSSKTRISLFDEIQYIKTYVYLENMRFKSPIAFKLKVAKELDLNEIEIPPMLTQPFVENVFMHAFDYKSLNPRLEIRFRQERNILICEIMDNGKGISKENLNSLHKSKGIKLAKERMKLSQHAFGESVLINSIPNKGTSVILKFIGSE